MAMKISELAKKQLFPGIQGKFFHTENNTIAFVDLDKDAILPEHAHFHEQTTEVIEGQLEFTVNGKTEVLVAGNIKHIPSNIKHSAKALTNCKVKDIFYPVREDYK